MSTGTPQASLVGRTLARGRALLPGRPELETLRRDPRRDLIAGLTVAVVALPLALAFGITSGLGAGAGLVTAVVAGAVAAAFGGSNLQVSGPTGAMTVVLVPIVASLGGGAVLVVGLLAGVILLGLAWTGAGRWMRYIPLPVVEGFTLGIACVIALQQVPAALGVPGHGEKVVAVAFDAVRTWFANPHWAEPVIAGLVVGVMLLAVRFRPAWPVSLPAVVVAAAVVSYGHLQVPVIGTIPSGLPVPSLPTVPWGSLSALVLPAVAVAALGALESLLSATVADGMSVGERHDPDKELLGQGLANLAVPFFGGIPATAAIARTAVNVRSGARSRLAAFTHAMVLLVVVVALAPLVAGIPLSALAGVLLATSFLMVEVSSVRALLRSTRGDAVVLVLTAVATVAFDLVTAVILGLVVAGFFALQQVARSSRADEESVVLDPAGHDAEESALLAEHIVAYRLEGSLFFGAAHAFLLELSEVSDVRVVILRMSRVVSLDATGASVLADTIARLEARQITVLLSGVRPEHEQVLTRLGVYDELAHERHVFTTTPDAIEHARAHAQRRQHAPGDS
ncbi:MAG TPA: SulP family inorganic anion transporter [Candidatus Nanopelagicales bacterium]|nr:SulP family inorganic anion transporter [Candidatus Nanopelagicales bacterium]